ncbi:MULTISPECIES: hypothetical protein [unclassified Streptomyces]|uniref:hypothetical protein n=1 Tax=unclassified Streptomyces TaxID=2593676 RepID=UPI00036F88CC|nr:MULTISPECIES: hypothetical protein [unclassified Streptomyces]
MSGTSPRLRTAVVLAAALLGGAAHQAAADDGSGTAVGNSGLVTVIDNSHADSILEVDRTGNLQTGSGTAGSDHDGSAVDMMEALVGAAHDEEEDGA